jgi:hypothetical protein
MAELVNRVAQSGLITIDLETLYPNPTFAEFDLKDYLFQWMVLREKDFRDALTNHDWAQYEGSALLVFCSADAIIPAWASMLVASHALPYARDIYNGTREAYLEVLFREIIREIDLDAYTDARVVVKGCGGKNVPPGAYSELVRRLQPVVRSLMFGEPCSTVPVYKKAR